MSRFEKLLPPPMRRPPKPGEGNGHVGSNGHGNGNGATALREGNGDGARTDDAGARVIDSPSK